MADVNMIGLDLAKNTFQAHGARADGSVVFGKKLRRDKVMAFFAGQPHCTVAMDGLGHGWIGHLRDVMNVGGGLHARYSKVRRVGS